MFVLLAVGSLTVNTWPVLTVIKIINCCCLIWVNAFTSSMPEKSQFLVYATNVDIRLIVVFITRRKIKISDHYRYLSLFLWIAYGKIWGSQRVSLNVVVALERGLGANESGETTGKCNKGHLFIKMWIYYEDFLSVTMFSGPAWPTNHMSVGRRPWMAQALLLYLKHIAWKFYCITS